MERLGFGTTRIDQLDVRLHKSVKSRVKQKHIRERADSVEQWGVVYRPLVRQRDLLLVDGADRVATYLYLQKEEIEVEWVDCTDEEAHFIRRHANAQRRHDPDEQAALLLEDLNAVQVAVMNEAPWIRRSTARAASRRLLAESRGLTERTLASKEQYSSKRLEPKEKPEKGPPVKELGMELDPEWAAQVHEVHGMMRSAASHLTKALTVLNKLNRSELPYPRARLQRLIAETKDLGAETRRAVPHSLCPYCKGIEQLQEKCSACGHQGFILDEQKEGIPARLWDHHYPVVATDGIYRPVEDFAEDDGDVEDLFR